MRRYYQRRLPSDMNKDYYYMLRNTPNAETVIVEYGFIDNLKDANKLKNNYKDYADAVIEAVLEYKNIPITETGYYIVKKGDSLWSIANKYNTNVNELKELNNLTTNTLSIGQKLKLPNYNLDIEDEIEIPNPQNTYTVKSGDTLYKIANNYGLTVDELKKLNNLTTNTLSIGQILLLSETNNNIEDNNSIIDYDYYTVKKGDTLYKIANMYETNVDLLKEINNLTTNTLSIGEILKVPKKIVETYTVKKGDTLWSIANDNNTTVNKLKEINNLINNTLSIGQQLLLK